MRVALGTMVSFCVASTVLHAQSFPADFNLADLDGSNGFVIDGALSDESSGASVAPAGDINGDGIDDLLIGTGVPQLCAIGNNADDGNAYVVFGGSGIGSSGSFALSSLDGSNGFVILRDWQSSAIQVSRAGDFNGDGWEDILVGGKNLDVGGLSDAGKCYVILGGPTLGTSGVFDLSTIDGTNGIALNGEGSFHNLGTDVSHAGDMDQDGYDDIMIGAAVGNRAYIVYGQATLPGAEMDVADLNTSGLLRGTKLTSTSGIRFGWAIDRAGDVNNDGFQDMLIGQHVAGAGEAIVIYGQTNFQVTNLDIATLTASEGLVIRGYADSSYTGYSLAGIGDVNADGIDDAMACAPQTLHNHPNANLDDRGECSVVFGDNTVGINGVQNTALLNGQNGFRIIGPLGGTLFGSTSSSAGDLNNDGWSDFMIAHARLTDEDNDTYVIFGGPALQHGTFFDITSLDGNNGFTIHGVNDIDNAGYATASAGDLNNDGKDDIVVGAPMANAPACDIPGPGASYVVFGQ